MKKMHFTLIISVLALVGALALFAHYRSQTPNRLGLRDTDRTRITFSSGGIIEAEVAVSQAKKAQGLSGRDPLPEKEGMLFVFAEPRELSFWMQGMTFALDFVWISGSRVIDIHTNVPPTGRDAIVSPREPSEVVLEVNAGTLRNMGIEIGDTVTIERIDS